MASNFTDRGLTVPGTTSAPAPQWQHGARFYDLTHDRNHEADSSAVNAQWLQAVFDEIGQNESSHEIADLTTELNEQLDTPELIEDEMSTALNGPTADLIQDDLPTNVLKHLLLRLHDARCQGTLSESNYATTKAAAIAQWLQGAPERTEQDSAPDDADANLTSELDACPDTRDLNADKIPAFAQNPDIDLLLKTTSSATPVAIDPFQPGSVIRERYVIEATIGHGGFASVYRARDLQNSQVGQNPQVALKVLHPAMRERPQAIARLKREFRQTQLLSHPSIVRVLDLDTHEGVWFMVMELLEGETLAERLSRCGYPISPPAEAYAALAAYAEGLSFAHAHHIAHGDFKPSNLFLLQDGSVRIIDFGSSLEMNMCSSGTEHDESNCAATPAYASPQVLARQAAEPRDDVFSFACVAFNVLVGRHPVTRLSSSAIQQWSDALESAALSSHQLTILKRGVAWHREDRPNSIHEFFHSLTTPEVADTDLEAIAEPVPTDIALVTPATSPASDAHIAPISNTEPALLPVVVSVPMPCVDKVANTEAVTPAMPIVVIADDDLDAMAEPVSTDVALVTPVTSPAPDVHIASSSNAEPDLLPVAVSAPMPCLDDVSTTQPATPAIPIAVAEPPSTALPIPSEVLTESESVPPPAPAQRRTDSASQSPAALIPPVLPPPMRTPSYRWLLLLVPICVGFLLFRSFDSDLGARAPVQSNSGPAGNMRSLASSAASMSQASADLRERATLSPISAEPAASLAPVPKKSQRTANRHAPAVTFDTPTMRVTERALVAAIILKRVNGHAGRLRVTWRLKAGSATAGRDFSGPLSGVAEFADLQQVRVLYVPLLSDPERHSDRTFVVELTNASKDATIAPVRKVQVTILPTS